ncbi:MAG: hypothetical protein ACOX5R_23025 [bacterium]
MPALPMHPGELFNMPPILPRPGDTILVHPGQYGRVVIKNSGLPGKVDYLQGIE